jgi:hypothetical protein
MQKKHDLSLKERETSAIIYRASSHTATSPRHSHRKRIFRLSVGRSAGSNCSSRMRSGCADVVRHQWEDEPAVKSETACVDRRNGCPKRRLFSGTEETGAKKMAEIAERSADEGQDGKQVWRESKTRYPFGN